MENKNQNLPPDPGPAEDNLNLRHYWHVILERRWLVLTAFISVFVLCLQWGSAQLPARLRPILGTLLILQLVVAAAALLLVGAMTVFLIAVVAFFVYKRHAAAGAAP